MLNLTRFHKERALRAAGQVVKRYPTAGDFTSVAEVDQLAADRQFLAACDAWDDAIDQAYRQLVATLPPFQVDPDMQDFASRCQDYGIAAGLAALNARVPHRYTALYQLDEGTLRNIELFDKLGEMRPGYLAEVPIDDSFCQFVLRDGEFRTFDSGQDDRLNGHPYKGAMAAYHGVPVLAGSGELFGSLCHFDIEVRALSDEEFSILEAAAKIISPYLLVKR
jgi:GAF domain-containing protein